MSNEKSSAFVISSGQQDSVVQNLKFKNLIKMTAKILSASHGNCPDSRTSLDLCWANNAPYVGPPYAFNIGPAAICSSALNQTNLLAYCWANVTDNIGPLLGHCILLILGKRHFCTVGPL